MDNKFLHIYISFLADILRIDKFDLDIKPDTKYFIYSDRDRNNNFMELHYCSDDMYNGNWIGFIYSIAHEMRHVFQQHLCWYKDINNDGSLNFDEIKEIEKLLSKYDNKSAGISNYINEIDANAFALFINIIVFNRKLSIDAKPFNVEHFKIAKKMYGIYNESYISLNIKKHNIMPYIELVELSVEKERLPYEFDLSHNCLISFE